MALVVLVFGLVVTAVGVLQWWGLLGRSSHVDALSERAYLGVPTGLAFVGFGVLFLLRDVSFVRQLFGAVSLVLLSLAVVGFVLMVVRPKAIRPAWQAGARRAWPSCATRGSSWLIRRPSLPAAGRRRRPYAGAPWPSPTPAPPSSTRVWRDRFTSWLAAPC